jgi:Transposase IS66 family
VDKFVADDIDMAVPIGGGDLVHEFEEFDPSAPLVMTADKLTKAPIACEAVRRIDELFEIEREINGRAPEQRLSVRQERSKPLVVAIEAWLRERR